MAAERVETCEEVGELARELGVRPRCLYKWRRKLEMVEPGLKSSPFLKKFVSKALVFVLAVVFLTLLIVIWQNAAVRQATPIIPGPRTVLLGIAELVRKGRLIRYIVASLFHVSWGFLSAVLVAIPLGLYLGSHRRADRALSPIIQILRPISPLAWIPISILWFGIGDLAATFLIFIATLLPLTVSTANAVRSIDPTLLNAGRNFGLSGYQMLYLVITSCSGSPTHRGFANRGRHFLARCGRGRNDCGELRLGLPDHRRAKLGKSVRGCCSLSSPL